MQAPASPDRRGVAATHPVQMALAGGKKNMQAKASGPTFFTERSLAAYLSVSDRTVRNWIRRGELPSYKLGASRRIDPADVATFLEQRREEAAA
jgi:excisionase family DNA binding protein